MKILQVRLGFATNSSSSHSVVVVNDPDGVKTTDVLITEEDTELFPGGYYFGWQQFILADVETKLAYLAGAIHDALERDGLPEWARNAIVKELVGEKRSYIDHQSVPSIPKKVGESFICKEFVEDFRQFLERRDVAILGGNDNDDNSDYVMQVMGKSYLEEFYELKKSSKRVNILRGDSANNVRARKDGDVWVLFNWDTGAKIRMSFVDEPTDTASRAPELVDLKITDRCPYGCPFCYEGSTPNGSSEPKLNLYSLSHHLADAGVFEVAIGGGEPTLHHDFWGLIESLHRNGVRPNFSTKNLEWLLDEEKVETVVRCCGGFAYSVTDTASLDMFTRAMDAHPRVEKKASINIPLGVCDSFLPWLAMSAAADRYIPVLLLDYKETGRGESFPKREIDYDRILKNIIGLKEECDAGRYLRVSVDTPLAARLEEKMKKAGISDKLFETKEGAYSCAIDAVKGTIAAHSYGAEEIELESDADNIIIDGWKKLQDALHEQVHD